MTQYKWTDPATGQETAQGIGNPTPITPSVPSIPTGATKITDPNYLKTAGLTEKDIFRQGKDIYQLPKINPMLNVETATPDVPVPEETNDVASYIAGLETGNKGLEAQLKMIEKQSASEKEVSEIRKRQDALTEQAVTTQQKALPITEQFGLTENTKNLQSILPQIENLKAQYDNAEIAQEGRKGLAGSIYGRQALIKRQKAIELAGLSAIAQAYQGNIELAQTTAKNMVEMELAPIQTQIDNQKWQLEQVNDQLTRDEQRKADSLKLVLGERQRLLDEEKDGMNKINEVMLSAAKGGASQTVLDRIRKATTYGEAVSIAKDYLREKTDDDVIGVNPVDLQFTDLSELPQEVVDGTPGWANVLISQASKDYGVPSSLISAIIKQESGFNPNAQNINDKEKSYGLGQINLMAHPQITEKQAKDPSFAVNFVAQRLKSMIDKYGIYEGIQAYNTPGAIGSEQLIRYANNVLSMAGVDTTASVTNSTINQSALNWASQINEGKATIANVPSNERSAVIDALANSGSLSDADAQITESLNNKINQIDDLINRVSTDGKGVVGPSGLARMALFSFNKLSGREQDFIGSVKQLISRETLDTLINLKRAGGTLGALSQTELNMLENAASKINGWEKKNDKGVGVGIWDISESAFKKELEIMKDLAQKAYQRASGGTGVVSIDPLDLGISNSTNPTNPLGI